MYRLVYLFVGSYLLVSVQLFSQDRKLYVDNFANILGSYHLEQELLDFAVENSVNELILYDLNKVHKRLSLVDSTQNSPLAKFIAKAKKVHNIKSISASGETSKFFLEVIHPYNLSRKKTEEQFDVYNIEYEYWNEKQSLNGGYYCETYLKNAKLKCNRKNSFSYFINSLFIMKELAKDDNLKIKTEAYVGKFTRDEIDKISENVDKLLIHDYVKKPEYSYLYVKDRLSYLDAIHSHIEVSILFSEENNFMGNWLRKHQFKKAEEVFYEQLEKEDIQLEEHLNFTGFTYYNYSFFKKNQKK